MTNFAIHNPSVFRPPNPWSYCYLKLTDNSYTSESPVWCETQHFRRHLEKVAYSSWHNLHPDIVNMKEDIMSTLMKNGVCDDLRHFLINRGN